MKRILSLLAVVLVLTGTSFAAVGADTGQPADAPRTDTPYPVEVRESESGDYRRVEKVYILKTTDDPAAIPTGSFEREGCRYTFLDLLREDHSETETREHTETVSTSSDTKDMSVILQKLDAAMELETEDGYSGTLTLDPKSITVEAAGYQSSSRTVSATRTFPNLSTADVSLVPKTAQENGRTLTLADVSWQTVAGTGPEAPTLFTATATYTGTATSSYATGYKISASYTGTLTHTTNDTVIYTAVFTGAPSKPAVSAVPAEPSKQPVSDPAPTFDILPVALGAALVLVAGGAGYGIFHLVKYIKRRRFQ